MSNNQADYAQDLVQLLRSEVKAVPSFGKDYDTTINQLLALLVQNGYSVEFYFTEKVQKQYNMKTPVISIKANNNGGYYMALDRDSGMRLGLNVSVNGRPIEITTSLDEVKTILVSKVGDPSGLSIRFVDLFAATRTVHFEQFLWTEEKQEVIEATPKSDSGKVVQLSSFRKR